MEELVNMLSEKTGLSAEQARLAADTVISYLKSKLPAGMGDQVDSALSGESGGLAGRLGGILGKKSA